MGHQNWYNQHMAIAIVIFLILFLIGFVALYIHRRQEVFEGEVVDKDIVENVNENIAANNRPGIRLGGSNNVTHTYIVKVRTAAGKTITWNISEGKYEIIKIGDRVSKPKGTMDLQIISSSTPAGPAPVPPAPPAQPPAPTV